MISVIMLASYTLELLAVLQIMSYFDHHNCAAKVLSFAQPGMKYVLWRPQRFCYLLNSCPAPSSNFFLISPGYGRAA